LGDDVGRVLRPRLRELDAALLERRILRIADHRVADLPLDLVERMHAGSRESPLYREALQTVLGTGSGGLGHRTSPLAATFRGNYAGSLTGPTEKVLNRANKAFGNGSRFPHILTTL